MDKLIFGLKVKTLREHRNLTQSKLAEMISVPMQHFLIYKRVSHARV